MHTQGKDHIETEGKAVMDKWKRKASDGATPDNSLIWDFQLTENHEKWVFTPVVLG